MEKFKLDNFRKEYGMEMPVVRTLPSGECRAIRQGILQKMKVDSLAGFFRKVETEFITVENAGAEDEEIEWHKILGQLGIPVPREVYLNFGNFETIDVMLFKDFCKYFSDVWYPSSDDIELFDRTGTWIISIRHYGALCYAKL